MGGWEGKLEGQVSRVGSAQALAMCCSKKVPSELSVGSRANQVKDAAGNLKSVYGCGDARIVRAESALISCAEPGKVGILCGA